MDLRARPSVVPLPTKADLEHLLLEQGRPLGSSRWDHAAIKREIEFIQDVVSAFDVQIVDPQFLVSRAGEVQMIDFDHWYFIDSDREYWAYDGKAPVKLKEWVGLEALSNDFKAKVEAALATL